MLSTISAILLLTISVIIVLWDSALLDIFTDQGTEMPGAWTVLVTGGAGFIGSHTLIPLVQANYNVIVVDNLVNAYKGEANEKPGSILRVEQILKKKINFYNCDIQDSIALTQIFDKHKIDCVIHFAALKAVGESVQIPLTYYKNNVGGTCILLEVMKEKNVTNFIYSSSATVYGKPKELPITEDHPTGQDCTNPYGKSKYFVENILEDLCKSDGSWSVISLRYFNPVGAHHSHLIGEDPQGTPNNLMPFIAQVAIGLKSKVQIFGNNYDTVDGTGVRDYIHIEDLADGHVKALNKLEESSGIGFKVYNLGTGTGYSVLQVINAFKAVSKKDIKYEFGERRPGDIDSSYADASLAHRELNWTAKKDLIQMCRDTWLWQSNNPNGYAQV